MWTNPTSEAPGVGMDREEMMIREELTQQCPKETPLFFWS